MTIDGVAQANNEPSGVFNLPQGGNGGKGMGKTEFLQLLTAQLQAQDPMNPQSDHEFVAQLAQFSNLEQAMEQNRQLEMLQMASNAMVNSTNTNLIGKEITANGDVINLLPGKAPGAVAFSMPSDSQQTIARVIDADGKVVKSIDLGPMRAGRRSFQWDGTNDKGDFMDMGVYRVDIQGYDGNGRATPAQLNVKGLVTGVTYENGFPELLVGESRVQPADILEIHMAAGDEPSSSGSQETNEDDATDEAGGLQGGIADIAASMIDDLEDGGGFDVLF